MVVGPSGGTVREYGLDLCRGSPNPLSVCPYVVERMIDLINVA